MPHPHLNVIGKMNASSLIAILEESKMTYVRENLSVYLHESLIELLKQVKKHEKPHHKKIRVKQFKKAEKSDLFNLHLELYLKKYKKLESKGLIEIDLNPDNGLSYDCSLTNSGLSVLKEISELESKWEEIIGIKDNDVEVLRNLALNSFEISYNHKKKRNFIF